MFVLVSRSAAWGDNNRAAYPTPPIDDERSRTCRWPQGPALRWTSHGVELLPPVRGRWKSGESSARDTDPRALRQQSNGPEDPAPDTSTGSQNPHQCIDGVAGRQQVLIITCSDQDRGRAHLMHQAPRFRRDVSG